MAGGARRDAFGPARDEPDGGELYAIYVEPESWSTGAGRALMDAAVARLRDGGFERRHLWVLEDNARARRFYELGGWSHDGGVRAAELGGTTVTELRYTT